MVQEEFRKKEKDLKEFPVVANQKINDELERLIGPMKDQNNSQINGILAQLFEEELQVENLQEELKRQQEQLSSEEKDMKKNKLKKISRIVELKQEFNALDDLLYQLQSKVKQNAIQI